MEGTPNGYMETSIQDRSMEGNIDGRGPKHPIYFSVLKPSVTFPRAPRFEPAPFSPPATTEYILAQHYRTDSSPVVPHPRTKSPERLQGRTLCAGSPAHCCVTAQSSSPVSRPPPPPPAPTSTSSHNLLRPSTRATPTTPHPTPLPPLLSS